MRWISLLFISLILLQGCSTGNDPPIVTLLKVPTSAEARKVHEMLWEITLPEDSVSASQFSLHLDEVNHRGTYGTALGPILAGYKKTIEATPELTSDGTILLSFSIQESKSTKLYYRLHINVDGNHYWSPERLLNIIPLPAFSKEFEDSLMNEAIEEWNLFSRANLPNK